MAEYTDEKEQMLAEFVANSQKVMDQLLVCIKSSAEVQDSLGKRQDMLLESQDRMYALLKEVVQAIEEVGDDS